MPVISISYNHKLGDRCPCGQGKLVLKKMPGGILLACEANGMHFRFATEGEQEKYTKAGRYVSRWPKGYIVTA
jgi:hypothetical protein